MILSDIDPYFCVCATVAIIPDSPSNIEIYGVVES